MRSKLRTDYKSDEAARFMASAVVIARMITELFNQNPELTDFHTKVEPSPEKIVRIAGPMPPNMVRAIQIAATDEHIVFAGFMRAYWGCCHFDGRDFKDQNNFVEFCKLTDVDCYIGIAPEDHVLADLVGLGFNHALASHFKWKDALENFARDESEFFGSGEFTLRDDDGFKDAMRRMKRGVDISTLH